MSWRRPSIGSDFGIRPEETSGDTDRCRPGNGRFSPGGPGKARGRFDAGRSSDLNGLLLSRRAGLPRSSASLWAAEPPLVAEGGKRAAESGRSGGGLACPLEGDGERSGEPSARPLRPRAGAPGAAWSVGGVAGGAGASPGPALPFPESAW